MSIKVENQSIKDRFSYAVSRYDKLDYASAKLVFEDLLKSGSPSDINTDDCNFNLASCFAATGDYRSALNLLSSLDSDSIDVLYNKALCYYRLFDYSNSLICLERLFERNVKLESTSVLEDNELNYSSSCIIESVNLRSAVIFKLSNNIGQARESFQELPIKKQEQLDFVSLHNHAIYDSETEYESCIDKLRFICNSFHQGNLNTLLPGREAFMNILTLLIDVGAIKEAKSFMKDYKSSIVATIPSYIYEYYLICLEELELESNSGDVIYKKLGELLERSKQQKFAPDNSFLINMVMHQGSILWKSNQFQLLEKLLLRYKTEIGLSDEWKKNLAHTLFMLDYRFEESSQLYEELMLNQEFVSNTDPAVLGNLCISYILSGRNGDAETLIKDIEADEVDSKFQASEGIDTFALKRYSRINKAENESSLLSVINLVIGTLYCVKYNYHFGLTRMFKILNPVEKRLTKDSWFMVKRCILSMLNCHCKQMIYIKDDLFEQTISFLIECERCTIQLETTFYPKQVSASEACDNYPQATNSSFISQSVSQEARYLRSIVLRIVHD